MQAMVWDRQVHVAVLNQLMGCHSRELLKELRLLVLSVIFSYMMTNRLNGGEGRIALAVIKNLWLKPLTLAIPKGRSNHTRCISSNCLLVLYSCYYYIDII